MPENFFFVWWLLFMLFSVLSRTSWINKLPLRPKPNYGKSYCRHHIAVSENDFATDLHRYIDAPSRNPGKLLKNLKPNAPFLLQRFWWQECSSDENSVTLLLDYDEDVDRDQAYEGASTLGGMQHFQIVLRISWRYTPNKGLGVSSSWEIENDAHHRSPGALEAIDYTILDLIEFSLGPKGQKALRTKAARFAGISNKRNSTEFEHQYTKTPQHVGAAKRQWPSPQDFNEAMQNPNIAFEDAFLKRCKPQLNALGLPQPITGAFASVYSVEAGDSTIAIKCFLREVDDQSTRYKMISDFILNDDLPSTVGFEFIENGILTGGSRFPVLKMQWVDGYSIQDYIDQYRFDTKAMEHLAGEFLYMVNDLRRAGIAHGDLQHGNIMICPEGLRLVDYDGMFVPGMEGMLSNELGHRNYQHPKRDAHHFGPYLDNFSAWLIYISLLAIAADPELWSIPSCGDENLLFRQADFVDPESSEMFKIFRSHANPEIREYGRILEQLCAMNVEDVPPLELGASTHQATEDGGCVIHLSPTPEKQPVFKI